MTDHTQSTDRLWRVFEADLDFYKFHLDLSVRLAVLFFTLSGAILAYSLAHYRENGMVVVALLLPSLLGVLLAVLSYRGAQAAEILRQDHEDTWDKIKAKGQPAFDLSFLRDVLRGLFCIYGLLAVVIFGLFLWLTISDQSPQRADVAEAPNHAAAPGGSAAGERPHRCALTYQGAAY
jgi:hypothetical protein